MKQITRATLFACAFVLALGVVGPAIRTAEAATLVYADEFDGPLNTSVWQQLTPWKTRYTTGELQYYTPENVSFANGNMRILTERRAVNGYSFASGIVTSLNRPFSYGYFESRFNMPTGKGLWPAFWLTNDRTHEIDMMELLGEDPTRMYFTYHKGGNQLFQRYFDNNTDLTAGWHTVGMDWQPTYIRWYLDGQLVAEY
ncbi:glycoside hydrolase family 16 protein, partial [bacterium]|nr:glycoside hydrolase family 16 protein [bacterium]